MDLPELDVEDDQSRQSTGDTEPAASLGQIDQGLLIEAIQRYPYLFDLSHKLYKDAKRKTLAWEHIGELLNCTVEECIKAWKNLRDRFAKEKNKVAPGAGAPETNWPFYEPMLFYGKFTKPRKTISSTRKSEGSRSPSRQSTGSMQSAGSRPSSSASAWSNVTYDVIMSPGSVTVESQPLPSEEESDAAGPSNRAKEEVVKGGARKAQNVIQTPTTSSGYGKKRKRVMQAEDEKKLWK